MELIIKPTLKCNFKCTFCSSTGNEETIKDLLSIEQIRQFIVRYPDTRTIIVNGGDPLMVPPEYYFEIIKVLDELDCKADISFTTNLWAFYKKPKMWEDLFRHPRVGICTSFQYGDARLKGDLTPYTEAEFWEVSNLMLSMFGYRPSFITVIDNGNSDTVIDTVKLAQQMGVEIKLNPAYSSGEQVSYKGVTIGNKGKAFLIADIYEKYIEIYDAGLMEWEHNTKQMSTRLILGDTSCPQNRNCDSSIRSMEPDGSYYSCGSFSDDRLYPIDFKQEMDGAKFLPLQVAELASMKLDCYTCPMFAICNGCKKTIHDHKNLGLVEQHCKKMKKLAPRIIEINGLTGSLMPTPYVDESINSLIFKG